MSLLKSFEMSRKVISIIKCLVNYFLVNQKLQAPDVCIYTGGEFHIYESLLVGRWNLLRSLRYLHDFPHIPIYFFLPISKLHIIFVKTDADHIQKLFHYILMCPSPSL